MQPGTTAAPAAPKPKPRLELLPSGAIERVDPDPETGGRLLVAKVEEGVLSFVTTNAKLREPIRGLLRARSIDFREQTEEEIAAGRVPETTPAKAEAKDWREGLKPAQIKAMIRLRREQGWPDVEVEKTTERFRFTSRLGDKEPAYVEWLLRYKPAKFARVYGIIGEADVRKFRLQKDPESLAVKKIAYVENCVMTKRKTHLTEKPSLVGGIGGVAREEAQDEETEGGLEE